MDDATQNDRRREYSQSGYCIFRGLVSPREIGDLIAATENAVRARVEPLAFEPPDEALHPDAAKAIPALYKDEAGRVFRRLNRVVERGGAFEQVACGPVARAVAQILSPPIFLCLNRHNMVMLKAPFNPTPVHWHQDAALWNEGVYDHLSVIVALDDFTPANGCLEVVPGSHKMGTLGLGAQNIETISAQHQSLLDSSAIKVPLQAGDALLFHGLLLHGSPGNHSAATRRSLTLGFYTGDLRAVSNATGDKVPEVREVFPAPQ